MDNLRELYQQVIIEHAKSPRNFGELKNTAHCANGFNPLCGDKLRLCLTIEEHKITEARFQGEGCAISMASASLLTESLKNKSTEEAEQLFSSFQDMLVNEQPPTDRLGKLTILHGVAEFPSRIKCAMLAWHALMAALKGDDEVSTE